MHAGSYDCKILVWDLDTGTVRQRSLPLNGHVRSIALSGTHLATVVTTWLPHDDNRIKLWRAIPGHPGVFDL